MSVGLYLSGQLKKELIKYLDESLLVQMRVEEIRFTGLESFPNVGVALYNVRIDESFPAYKSNLVSAGSIEIRVNPFALLRNEIRVRKLQVNQATFRIYNGVQGNTNFAIFKSTDNDSSRLNIEFDNLLFKNCRLVYLDEKDLVSCNALFYKFKAKGSIGEENLDLDLSFHGLFDHIRLGEEKYLVGKHTNWSSELHVNKKLNACNIASAVFGMEDLQLNVFGDILMVKGKPDLDLKFATDKLQIQGIFSLLPNHFSSQVGEWSTEGDFSLSGTIKGLMDKDALPKLDAALKVKNGKITGEPGTFRNVNLDASLNNGNGTSALALTADLQSLEFNDTDLKLKVQTDDISRNLNIQSSSLQIDLNDLCVLFPAVCPYRIKGVLGLEVLGELNYESDFLPNLSGMVNLSKASIGWPRSEQPLIFDCKGKLMGEDVIDISANIGFLSEQILLEGDLKKYTGFWLDDRPQWIGDITAQEINFSEWLNSDSAEESGSTNGTADLDIGLDVQGNFNLGRLLYDGLSLNDLSGRLELGRDRMEIGNVEFGAWKGTHKLSMLFLEEGEYYKMFAKGRSKGADLKELFREFEDFEQSEITHENLSGLVTTAYDLSATFDTYFNLVERELFCSADVLIEDGRLMGYKPLEELSLFLELDDLRDISFKDLENRVEIRNGIIFLPETELNNSALNLSVSGSHTLENYLDYHLKVKVTDVLAKRSKWVEKKNAKRLEEGRDGGLTAYVKMTGTPDDLKITYDSKTAGREFRSKFKEERKSFFKEVGREIRGERAEQVDQKTVKWIE